MHKFDPPMRTDSDFMMISMIKHLEALSEGMFHGNDPEHVDDSRGKLIETITIADKHRNFIYGHLLQVHHI